MTTNPNELTERVARAISDAAWDNMRAQGFSGGWDHDELGRALATAAIAAMQSASLATSDTWTDRHQPFHSNAALASPATSEDVVKLPQAALDAWVAYDPPELKHESARIRDAFMSGFLAASPTPRDTLALEWRDGPPPKPWCNEWFIALTTYGDRVVLRSLPEEYTYDFKTADDTYIKADKIAKWMQFPDSEYIAPAALKDTQQSEGRES